MFVLFRGRLKVPIRSRREAIQVRMCPRAHPRDTPMPALAHGGARLADFAGTEAVGAKVPVVGRKRPSAGLLCSFRARAGVSGGVPVAPALFCVCVVS